MISFLLTPWGDVCLDPIGYLIERGPWREYHDDPRLFQVRLVGLRDDPASKNQDVGRITFVELLHHLGEKRLVGSGQAGKSNRVNVFLDGGLGDLRGRLMKSRVDDFVARIAQRPGDYLGAPIVTIQAGLGNEDSTGHTGDRG